MQVFYPFRSRGDPLWLTLLPRLQESPENSRTGARSLIRDIPEYTRCATACRAKKASADQPLCSAPH